VQLSIPTGPVLAGERSCGTSTRIQTLLHKIETHFVSADRIGFCTWKKKGVRVKIFGSEYPLRGESEEFTKKVAGYVDSMITTIHDKIPEQPPLTISVLAALKYLRKICLRKREKNKEIVSEFESDIIKISNYLDTSLHTEP